MDTVVAIDGPAGAGKSTVARLLAERMGFAYVNTGSLYRALALCAQRAGIDPGALSEEFLHKQQLEFRGADLYLNGTLLGDELRAPEVARGASLVSKQKCVRDYLLPVQRGAAKNCWIVMEGRDIGTVIFPEAKYKFFVTATPEERARRRMAQSGEVAAGADFEYRGRLTGPYYSLLRQVIKALMLDPHEEMSSAWRAVIAAGGPEKVPEAMKKFNELPFSYEEAGKMAKALQIGKENSASEVAALMREWSRRASENYREAERLAMEGR